MAGAPKNWRETLSRLLPGWLLGPHGERFMGLIALYADLSSLGTGEAARAPWVLEETSPEDALPLIGADASLPRYPYETSEDYRARIANKWQIWESAGTRACIIDQFEALGFEAEIYSDLEWPRPPTPWESKFTIFLRDAPGFGPAPICGTDGLACGPPGVYGESGALCGDDVHAGDEGLLCGDETVWTGGHLCGVTGDVQIIAAMRTIVRKFKAGDEICPEILIPDGPICGDGSLCNDGSLCGGEAISIWTT